MTSTGTMIILTFIVTMITLLVLEFKEFFDGMKMSSNDPICNFESSLNRILTTPVFLFLAGSEKELFYMYLNEWTSLFVKIRVARKK